MRGELIQDRFGSLWIWKRPEPGRQYAIGVDSSGGHRGQDRANDPSAACVIEMESCEQVAEWSGYYIPNLWGFRVSRLGWYYNDAHLAIETHPSPHGIAVFDAAQRYGYLNLSCQMQAERRDRKPNEKKGWTRPANSLEVVYNRGREALQDRAVIRSAALLEELSAVNIREGKLDNTTKNDRIIAWCLALLARDQAYHRGEIRKREKPIEDLSDLDWRQESMEATVGATPRDESDDIYAGY